MVTRLAAEGEAAIMGRRACGQRQPEGPIVMSGGRRARISSGVMDPIGVTALVLESVGEDGETAELVAQVSVEISSVREDVMGVKRRDSTWPVRS
jgi:hypothetical protein